MEQKQCRITVLGDGGWGTPLAVYLTRQNHSVTLWGAFPKYIELLRSKRENPRFLPGIAISRKTKLTADLKAAVVDAQVVILAVPSQYLRGVVKQLSGRLPGNCLIISVAKGLENKTLCRMSEVVKEELRSVPLAVLSGPNIAREIAEGHPATAVVACRQADLARNIQQILMSKQLRIYTTDDLAGVELGGALKNPLAIAAGIADGLGFGSNAKAALITRGIVEMARLGVSLGGKAETFWGLSGLGDLITTCLSGRNHWLGQQLGVGRKLKAILRSTPMVVEGVETCRAAVALGARQIIELPIIEQVYAVLFRNQSPRKAIERLMMRTGKSESVVQSRRKGRE